MNFERLPTEMRQLSSMSKTPPASRQMVLSVSHSLSFSTAVGSCMNRLEQASSRIAEKTASCETLRSDGRNWPGEMPMLSMKA